ncbi:MAG: hypothetical protein JW888_12105 [Pirellulales bacterium]|nr:hypothetical protein [Pirellulales bacterium]
MPAEFAKMGIRFQYPENWSVSEDISLAGCRSVTVNSPASAFWTLSIHPRLTDPTQLVEVAVQVMREEYKEIEGEMVCEEIEGHQLIGQDINFYCLDLTNTAWIRSVRTDQATYTILCQAEDREFDQIGDVFRAMITSFLANIGSLAKED